MKIVKIIALILLVAFVGIQFIPTTRNQSEVVPMSDFMLLHNVPEEIKNTLQISCYDCHSNNTSYPWYNKIQPAAWILENHIKKGKKELNFSEFSSYSVRRQRSKLKSIVSQIEDGEMPISSYTLIHGDAKLSKSDKELITKWFLQLRDDILKR